MTAPIRVKTQVSTITVIKGEFAPWCKVTHCTDGKCVTLVGQVIDSVDFAAREADGFEIVDPHGFVTCECGNLKGWLEEECAGCAQMYVDYLADEQMYAELAQGG